MIEFTRQDHIDAAAQGWGIFEIEGKGVFQLQKDDERKMFRDDACAWTYVFSRAFVGDKLAEKALDFLKERAPEELRRINQTFPGLMVQTRWDMRP